MSLKVAIDNLKFDKRMLDINLKSQHLSQEEMTQRLNKLPDLQSSSMAIDLDSSTDSDSLSDVE